jgi:hypothetical protein
MSLFNWCLTPTLAVFQLYHGDYIVLMLTCWISRIQYGGSFTLEPIVTTCQLWILLPIKTCVI